MDPEVIAQLEEQLRLMNELLTQQNSMMAAQMGAMQNAGGKLNAAAGSFAKGLGANQQVTTKYAEAQAKAAESSEKWDKAAKASQMTLTAFSAAVSSTSNVLGSLGGALLSAEKGFSKYGGTVDAAASAAQGLASSLPIVGQALGAIVGVAGQIASKVVGDALKLTDAIVNLRDETVKTAGALPTSSEGLLKLANDAKYFGENIQTLGKITQGLGTGLITLGKTAGDGAVKFMELANVSEETRQAFGKMGISQEQLTEMQATYIKQQQSSGLAYLSQNKSIDQLRKESLKYAENLNALSSLTGKQADALRAEQDIAAAVMQEKIAQRQDLVELKRLRDNKQFAEAAELEAKMKSMADYRDTMSNLVGPEQTALYMNYMRTGVYNNISAPLAVLGADLETARTQLARGADGMKVAAQSADDLTAKQSTMATNLGQAALHMDEQSLAGTGLLKDSIGRLNDTFGQSAEERLAAAKKTQEERKEGSPMDDAIEKARSAERALQQKYQEFLIDGIKKAAALLNATDLNKLAADAMRYGLIALKAGLAVATVATGVLAAAKWKEWRASVAAKEAQKDFTKALRESAAAMKQQTSASRDATRADTAEARASGSAASADRSESSASNRARAADIAESRASRRATQADQRQASASQRAALASQRAASASQRAAAASQRAASADMREAAASMKAAAADLREARASDAAAAADRREAMSGGGGGGGGKGGKLLKFGKGLAGGIGGLLGGLALDYGAEKAEEAGHTKTSGALGVGSAAVTGAGLGLMFGPMGAAVGGVLGGLYGLYQNSDKLLGTGKPNASTSETAEAAEQLTSAAESLEESNKETIANSLAILNSASSAGGVEKMTPEQLAAYGITPEVAPVVAQEPGTSEKEKAAQAGYTIQKGDTLSKLAEQYGTTVEALMEANKQITNKDLIYEGAQLNIPGQEKERPTEYEVKKGDTLGKIAEQYGTSYEELIKSNPNLKNKDWKVGYKLNIPGMGIDGQLPGEDSLQEITDKAQQEATARKREDNSLLEEKKEITDKLAASSNTLDSTLAATNKALKIFRELIVSINAALGGVDDEGNATGPGGQSPIVGPGNTAYTGNAAQAADVNSVMAMNLAKESAGGTQLRVRGLGGAGSIGGAYGLSQAARNSAFSSMSADEQQQFTAQTGFSRAPTLDELVNKKGTAFTSDKAKLADQLLAQKFTENTISRLTKRLGRTPTMADIRGAHWLGEAGYIGLLEAAKQNPNMTMEAFYASHPDWTKPDMKQFPGTVGEMISKIAEQAGGGVGAAAPTGGGFLGAVQRSTQGMQDFNQTLGGAPGGAGGMPSAAENGNIIALGKMLQSKYGLRVDENIYFDGKHPAPGTHSKTGGHYDGTAIDVNAPGSVVEANHPKWGPLFDDIARAGAAAGYHTLWKSPDGKHNNHIHFQYSSSMGKNSKIGAERGGILKGPDSGYPVELHGTEMVIPLDNRFTRSMNKSSEQYTVNGKPVDKKAYDSFMQANPELQNIQQKVQSMLGAISNDKLDPAKIINSMSRLMDNNLTGVKDEVIDKNKKIQDSLIQLVSRETNRALQAINETNQPMQNAAMAITNSMQTVMKAHTSSMNELSYRLGQMVDAMETSNDVTKKILKKASA
jgi:LysM repeat protein